MILPPSALSITSYHNCAPDWLSKTSIRDFRDHGPQWWKLAYLDRSIPRPVPGGVLQGNMLDCYLTEGAGAFESRYFILPEDAPNRPSARQVNAKKPSPETLAAIDYWKALEGQTPVGRDDMAILWDAVAAVKALPCWPEIEQAQAQMTIRRHSEGLGLGLQARPDWLSIPRATLWDLKKTRDLDAFGRQAIDLGYHLQAAIAGWCLAGNGVLLEHAHLIAVEWERGARARMYEIPHDALAYADRQMRGIAAEIADRLKRKDWTDRQSAAEELPIPGWLMAKIEQAA